MGERFRSWWQQIKQHLVASILIALFIVLGLLVLIGGYKLNWAWTGFNGVKVTYKTLYDWLQLLIIPAVLTVAGYVINLTISKGEQEATKQHAQSEREAVEKRAETEREIALDNQRETALKEYIDKMSELVLHEGLLESNPKIEVREIARIQTLTVLNRLDGKRKGSVLQFLIGSALIENDGTVLNMEKADFSGVHLIKGYVGEIDLHKTNLSEANIINVILLGANLSDADLSEANLTETTLFMANLHGANLQGTNLSKVDISEADLSYAKLKGVIGITVEELEKQAKSLKGATMPDGSKHP